MAAGYPSHSNVFIPSHEASGGLTIGFSRNPKKFPLNQYCKIVPVDKDTGYYLQITAEEASRIINTSGQDFVWADNQVAPSGDDNLESFQYQTYRCQRYCFPFNLGAKTVAQADWKVLEVHAGIAAQKAMTFRTQVAWNALTTSSNWNSANTGSATSIVGGYLDQSTTLTLYIKKLFRYVAETVLKSTIGVMQRNDLVCVMNPHTAGLISESPELIDHFKNNQFALAHVKQDGVDTAQWGLPPVLYGIKIVIEDAVKTTTPKQVTDSPTQTYVCPAQTLVFMSRPGGLMGMQGIPDFATAQFFMYSEFEVESRYDANDRMHHGRIIEDYGFNVVAPGAGFYVTGATSS